MTRLDALKLGGLLIALTFSIAAYWTARQARLDRTPIELDRCLNSGATYQCDCIPPAGRGGPHP